MSKKVILNFFLLEVFVLCLFVFCQDNSNAKQKEAYPNKSQNVKASQIAPITNGVSKVSIKTIGNTMSEMAFEPNFITVKKNTKVEITLVNEGKDETMVHNLLIVKKGKIDEVGLKAIRAKESAYIPESAHIIAASPLVQPLQTRSFTFDAPAVGTYGFLCTYPGHYMKMRGKFVVVD